MIKSINCRHENVLLNITANIRKMIILFEHQISRSFFPATDPSAKLTSAKFINLSGKTREKRAKSVVWASPEKRVGKLALLNRLFVRHTGQVFLPNKSFAVDEWQKKILQRVHNEPEAPFFPYRPIEGRVCAAFEQFASFNWRTPA